MRTRRRVWRRRRRRRKMRARRRRSSKPVSRADFGFALAAPLLQWSGEGARLRVR